MKHFLQLAVFLAVSIGAMAAGLGDIKSVYVLPMANGLDQYLAVRLTSDALLQVVTDPQKADAVLSDHIGQSFEEQFDTLYGSKAKLDENGKAATAAESSQTFARVGSGNARSRGTLFLVNRKTKDVAWSVYERSTDRSPKALKRTADKIAEALAKAIKGK
jgi:hypothetical protein